MERVLAIYFMDQYESRIIKEELTDDEVEEIAESWINKQNRTLKKENILDEIFKEMHNRCL